MNAFAFDRDDTRIDALVDGELPEAERRTLLEQLEATPGGWRACALAFLEAQSWREAFVETARESSPKPLVVTQPKRIPIASWLARAAVVFLAFGLGWAIRVPQTRNVDSSVARIPKTEPRPNPVRDEADTAPVPETPAPADYVQGRLEREGFEVERTKVLIPTATKDGRPVAVPVQRMRVRFVGNRSV